MKEIYHWIGVIIFWGGGITLSLLILFKILEITLNTLAKKVDQMWVLIDFLLYRESFKEFMKDKKTFKEKRDERF